MTAQLTQDQKNQKLYLADFIKAYIEAMLWSSTGDDEKPLDEKYSENDFADETRVRIETDCEKFVSANWVLLKYADDCGEDAGNAGHDFWLTREGHGCGFWSRDLDEDDLGDKLTKECEKFGNLDIYVGDDGKLYF